MVQPDPRGLGQLQEEILRRMLEAYERLEAPGPGAEYSRRSLEAWGVRWDHLRNAAGWETPSQAAAASRALRRLEDRGLLRRRNQHSGDRYMNHNPFSYDPLAHKHRTTHAQFTPDGRAEATRLTKGKR